jgi:hypothetical protein
MAGLIQIVRMVMVVTILVFKLRATTINEKCTLHSDSALPGLKLGPNFPRDIEAAQRLTVSNNCLNSDYRVCERLMLNLTLQASGFKLLASSL